MKNLNIKNWPLDIRFWIVALFLIRLENIALPPYEGHGWRQCTTLSMTRGMFDDGVSLLYPKTMIHAAHNGVIASEMPILNLFCHPFNLVFGYSDWYGRLVNLLIASFGMWFFYLFSRQILPERAAFGSAIAWGVSIAFIFARKTMPDVFAMSFMLAAAHFGQRYLNGSGSRRDLWLFFAAAALGLLSKMPVVVSLSLLLPAFLQRAHSFGRKAWLAIAAMSAVCIMSIWYFVWVPHLLAEGAFKLYFPFPFLEGWQELVHRQVEAWERIRDTALQSVVSFWFCLVGLFFLLKNGQWRVFAMLLAYAFTFFFFVVKSGNVFPTHNYYIIPFIPMMAILVGYGLDCFLSGLRWSQWAVLAWIAFEAISRQKPDFFLDAAARTRLKLEGIADVFSKPSDLILTNRALDPSLNYALRRRGETTTSHNLVAHADWYADYAKNGLRFILIDKSEPCDSLSLPVVYDDLNFRAYRIEAR